MGVTLFTQDQHAGSIYQQTDHCHQNSLVILNINRVDEPVDTFITHIQGNDNEKNGARVTCQGIHLAGPEAELLVMSVPAGIDIGKEADPQPNHVRAHMDAIGEQCHRAKCQSGCDFKNHHKCGDYDDYQCSPFTCTNLVLPKDMGMLPFCNCFCVHFNDLKKKSLYM